MNPDLLLSTSPELTDDDAGGHGARWGVFDDDVPSLMGKWLGVAVNDAEASRFGMNDPFALGQLVAQGEPSAFALLHTGQARGEGQAGLMALIHQDPGGPDHAPRNALWSAFPFFGDGRQVLAEVEEIGVFPNRIEARLRLGLSSGAVVFAFDSGFVQSRAVYRAGERYRFVLSALAYDMGPAQSLDHVIDDADEIRRFHARNAWSEVHGGWTMEDEAASLAAWQPQSPEDLEPIHINLGQMAVLLPSSTGPADDAQYVGEVVQVTPRAVRVLDVDFWRVDTVVIRAEEDVVIPIYVAEHLFENDWRPEVGQYVTGSLWLQAYALGLEKSPT
ncbi:hypothetical protein B9Z47_16525 [Limnohabitans sp. 2KL-1]|uniref:hypothetical protein n=1 Tax=Limnohabitans sp. 2KL-1 TaxID=1100699 RepID=UPI000D382D95|nr:hypothetical protein [Limnohabitans sp. 2KL-1]PUE45231.1 hypothetical protein B9Z47_16525 [Limnohabitans sp. 2KL-1]